MTSSLGLAGVLADVAIMLVLVAALASPTISQLGRLVMATFAFVCAWLLTAAFGGLRAPGWTMFTGSAVIGVSIAAMLATVHAWTQAGEGGESGGGHRGSYGGGGPRGEPDAPQRGDGGHDPSWWLEFERQLALYVAERDGRKQQAVVLPGGSGAVRDDTSAPAESFV